MIIVNNKKELNWRIGMTVQDVLDEMKYSFTLIVVTVNDVLISKENYMTTELNDIDRVCVFHIAHGG